MKILHNITYTSEITDSDGRTNRYENRWQLTRSRRLTDLGCQRIIRAESGCKSAIVVRVEALIDNR